mgnify:CR=1 FL=1|jgi:hypothetical protein
MPKQQSPEWIRDNLANLCSRVRCNQKSATLFRDLAFGGLVDF